MKMMPLWNHRLGGQARHPCNGLTPKRPERGSTSSHSKLTPSKPRVPSIIVGCVGKVSRHRGEPPLTGRCVTTRNGYHTRHAEGSPVRPHLVTIIRPNEDGLVRKISLLLNRRAVVSFEQLTGDVSEALGYPCWNNDRVRHLFSPAGKAITSLSHFFQAGDAFLALGQIRPSLPSLQLALEELYPDSQNYCLQLLKRWERNLRPKASKADSGFQDDSPRVDNSPSSTQSNGLAANSLQPIQERQLPKGRVLTEEHKKDTERHLRGRKEKVVESYPKPRSYVDQQPHMLSWRQGEQKPRCRKHTASKCSHRQAGSTLGSTSTHMQTPPPLLSKVADSVETMISKDPVKQEVSRILPALPDGEEVTQMDIERCYDIGRVVGDGNFAVVHVCVEKGTGHTRAMKVVDKAKLQGRDHMIHNEVSLLASLRHPRVVHLLRCHHTDTHVYLIMELASEGDLFDAIVASVKFSEVCAAGMFRDISDALQFIHSRSIVHRDIKPENLLVHRHDGGAVTLKLADFGLALVVTEPLFTVCGTPTYVAPEILAETGYGIAVDVWAMGVILYILLCGFPPFRSSDRNQVELFRLIRNGDLHFQPPYWDKISEGVKDLIRGLLQVDPSERLTARQAFQHNWVRSQGRATDQHPRKKRQLTSLESTPPPQPGVDPRIPPQIGLASRDSSHRILQAVGAVTQQSSIERMKGDHGARPLWIREARLVGAKMSGSFSQGGSIETNTTANEDLTSS